MKEDIRENEFQVWSACVGAALGHRAGICFILFYFCKWSSLFSDPPTLGFCLFRGCFILVIKLNTISGQIKGG